VSAERQQAIFDYDDEAVAEGATVAAGGGVPEDRDTGYFVGPTVLTDVTDEMAVAREEVFGPYCR